MNHPSITILIPTYEPKAGHLEEALESVKKQTHKEWTVYIHDDASTTDVRSIVEPYLKDKRFTFERSGIRAGIGGNWNLCLKAAIGPFVQFLFQDDGWDPHYLEHSLSAFTREHIGLVAVNHRYAFEGNLGLRGELYKEVAAVRTGAFSKEWLSGTAFLEWWMDRGLTPNVMGEPSFVMMRRDLVEKVGPFHETMTQALDMEYWLRCLLVSDVAFVPEELGEFRVHASAASAEHDRTGQGLFDRLACFEMLLIELPRGALRSRAAKALQEQFGKMISKFFHRVGGGGQVSAGGSAAALRLMMRHPLLVLRGVCGL